MGALLGIGDGIADRLGLMGALRLEIELVRPEGLGIALCAAVGSAPGFTESALSLRAEYALQLELRALELFAGLEGGPAYVRQTIDRGWSNNSLGLQVGPRAGGAIRLLDGLELATRTGAPFCSRLLPRRAIPSPRGLPASARAGALRLLFRKASVASLQASKCGACRGLRSKLATAGASAILPVSKLARKARHLMNIPDLRPRYAALAVVLAFAAGCAGQSASRRDGAKQLAPESPPGSFVTPSGIALTVPEGMLGRQEGAWIFVEDAEKSVRLALVELAATDLERAIREAVAHEDPSLTSKPDKVLTPPARNGWDELRIETRSLESGEAFQAFANRKGERTWVTLLRGSPGGFAKRSAQINVFLGGLKPPGEEEKDLSEVEPRSVRGSEQLRAFVREAMQASGVPGFSIAVVEGDEVVFAEGYGVREIGGSEPVTADTLMMIGSVTKSMSTLLMASLVDEGKLAWTDRAIDRLPGFAVGDPELTRELQVEQLVCACAGLPRKDLPMIINFKGKDAGVTLRQLAGIRPTTRLKETFQYQNQMVAAGGYLAGHVFDPKAPLQEAYCRAMRERVFGPMGMTRTTLDFEAALADPDRASPHAQDLKGRQQKVSLEHERFSKHVGPSGGAWSSAREMARYLLTELNRGVYRGVRVASEASLTRRWEPQVKVNAKAAYGLGWGTLEEHGLRQIEHGGATMGFNSYVRFLPEKKLGVVMLANGTNGRLGLVWARLMELWFGIDEKAGERLAYGRSTELKEREELQARLSQPPEEWIAPLLGTWADDELGRMTIERDAAGAIVLRNEIFTTRLMRHGRPDGKQVLVFVDPPLAGMVLAPQPEGLVMESAQERYLLRKSEG
ncbi:MAG TPA: hypothetical protein DFS52_19610 [Myxococcales bacterium]|nr:hypothetical protein [Myxococcales bacterium]